jgi:hypothetical protein
MSTGYFDAIGVRLRSVLAKPHKALAALRMAGPSA